MNAILQTDSWIETETCDGPRNTQNQRSREAGGVIMTDIQDKYIPEFTLPYRNVDRYIKEIANSWDRLDQDQRKSVRKSFKGMKICERSSDERSSDEVEGFSGGIPDGNMGCAMEYILKDSNNIVEILDLLWNPTPDQSMLFSNKQATIKDIKRGINEWGMNNMIALHYNWRSGLAVFFMIVFFIVIGVVIGKLSK